MGLRCLSEPRALDRISAHMAAVCDLTAVAPAPSLRLKAMPAPSVHYRLAMGEYQGWPSYILLSGAGVIWQAFRLIRGLSADAGA